MGYEDLSVVKLRELLKDRGLPVYGSKADLVARLQAFGEPTEPEVAEPEVEQAPVGHRRIHEYAVTVADDLYLSDDAWHEANKQACLAEADRLGLLPVGGTDAVQYTHEVLPDGRVRLTYTVPVARSS
jgi:hypothetical protein